MVKNGTKLRIEETKFKIRTRRLIFRGRNMAEGREKIENGRQNFPKICNILAGSVSFIEIPIRHSVLSPHVVFQGGGLLYYKGPGGVGLNAPTPPCHGLFLALFLKSPFFRFCSQHGLNMCLIWTPRHFPNQSKIDKKTPHMLDIVFNRFCIHFEGLLG